MKPFAFNKLVQEKRAKILLLVLVLFIAGSAYKADGVAPPDLEQIVKSDGEIMCFARGNEISSALAWSYPIPKNKTEDLPKSDVYYVPPRTNDDFNCNFEAEKTSSDAWTLTNFSISKSSEPVTDARWEDFKIMYIWDNLNEAIDRKIPLPSSPFFDLGFSVRTDGGVTIWLCEGWRPDKYPCLLLKLGLPDKRRVSLERNDNATSPKVFLRSSDIFSEHEWKHFQLSYDHERGLQLMDVMRNESLAYYAPENNTAFKPLFLFMTSATPSLWKIHDNHFLHANISTVAKFGPQIAAESSVICVSLYVSTCRGCSMSFFVVKNNTQRIVVANVNFEDTVESEKLPRWKNFKFLINDNEEDYVQLHVETIGTASDKFWKIDDVRICHEDEVKVATLSVQKTLAVGDETRISCHSLHSPEWTPNKQHSPPSDGLPIIEHEFSPTVIKLSWTEANPRYYAIKYEGCDLCKYNDTQPIHEQYRSRKRLKSNGWIVTNQESAVIRNLVPYTFYSVDFQDLIYPQNKTLSLNTLKTEKPLLEEWPENVRVKPTEDSAKLFFDPVKCNATYGPLVYRVTYKNNRLNFSKEFVDVKSSYGAENLSPFTDYNLTIEVARDVPSLDKPRLKLVRNYNFTTRPAVAPAVRDLEVYETDDTSVSIRFDLPEQCKGRPKSVRIQYCHPLYLNGCEFQINEVRKCKIWEDKYCSEIRDLVRNHSYWLAVSLKNENTHSFGTETHVLATTVVTKPGPPVNLTYKVTHYNDETYYYDVDIMWSHPYNQNGPITAFDVFLVEDDEIVGKSIHEVLQIPNGTYQRDYVKSIKFVPFVAKCNISVRAINDRYKSEFVSVEVQTEHFRNYLDQVPTVVNHTATSLFVNVPALDRRLGTYTLTIVVQNTANEAVVDRHLVLLADDNLCMKDVESWIATVVEITEDRIPLIEIGDGAEMNFTTLNQTIVNKPLQPNKKYCINYIIKNVYKKTEHSIVFREAYTNTVPDSFQADKPNKYVIIIISLIIFTVTIFVVLVLYKYGEGIFCRRRYRQDGEHIYEAMPFDDFSEPNVAYNVTYDKLKH